MIDGKHVLAIIPARGGSKGVHRKNIRVIAGRPLIGYTIEAAQQSRYLDEVLVSSEDQEILDVASGYGVKTLNRPSHLAKDDSPGIAPVLHALDQIPGYDYVVLLQPTSPLRTAQHIEGVLEFCVACKAPACVSICEADPSPFSAFQLDDAHHLTRVIEREAPQRRQELPSTYVLNGAVYAASIPWLQERQHFLDKETVGFLMPAEYSLDIDTEQDLLFFEFLMASRIN